MIIDLLRLLEDLNSAHGSGFLLRIPHIVTSLKNPLTAKMNNKSIHHYIIGRPLVFLQLMGE